ncbi:MAG: hypothetical protein CL581_19745 [Alteromonadaceae bacterium]|uniref:DUF2780 domain-containing protein n=1 Tax=unclassified Marinobacter TaxID=83889 RepID=UPI000C67BBF6|nr:DUF2780 domain-containing protein [Marinobacter sp. BGYM27]MAA66997.1 hypothetical protein [Alteromonadaceae bacterium]MBH83972.1 hypothetical protein [Alteromonadaceae bacterium]MDG5499441.1 DUF2780 domain-containing protein [Marinobacter sp. BGYM27]|tara:strand:+ start:5746 stop:6258 length:513 start_codon:yes stop_codon:yes gene_type:complete
MSTILKRFLIVSSLYLLAPTANALDLGTKLNTGALDLPQQSVKVSGEAQQLVGTLQEQLGVTKTQAAGGTGALLQLAQNQLDGNSFSQVTDSVSGLSGLLGGGSGGSGSLLSSALSNISSMDGVEKAFSALGLQSGAIEQFAPIVLGFLKEQGLGADIIGNLSSLWGVGS